MPARNLIAGLAKEKSLKQRLEDIEGTVRSGRVAGIKAKRLSDIAPDLGIIESGEFRVGNGAEPGAGFTGGRMAWPEMTYGGSNFFLVGVSNDTAQVGLSLDDGKLYAGGGTITADSTGLYVKADGGGRLVYFNTGDASVVTLDATAGTNDTFTVYVNKSNVADVGVFAVTVAASTGRTLEFRLQQNGLDGQVNLYPSLGTLNGVRLGDSNPPTAMLDVVGGIKSSASIGTNDNINASGTLNVSQALTVGASRTTVQASAFLNLQQSGTLVIASASITAKGSRHRVDGSGAATLTDLEGINGLNDGDMVILQTVNNARDVKLRHNTTNGNILLSSNSDRTLGVNTDMFVGIYNSDTSKVSEWGKI